MEAIAVFLGLMIIFAILDFFALRWGVDSRDSINSQEWDRRKNWSPFAPSHHH